MQRLGSRSKESDIAADQMGMARASFALFLAVVLVATACSGTGVTVEGVGEDGQVLSSVVDVEAPLRGAPVDAALIINRVALDAPWEPNEDELRVTTPGMALHDRPCDTLRLLSSPSHAQERTNQIWLVPGNMFMLLTLDSYEFADVKEAQEFEASFAGAVQDCAVMNAATQSVAVTVAPYDLGALDLELDRFQAISVVSEVSTETAVATRHGNIVFVLTSMGDREYATADLVVGRDQIISRLSAALEEPADS